LSYHSSWFHILSGPVDDPIVSESGVRCLHEKG
jgi:hypothetical protein